MLSLKCIFSVGQKCGNIFFLVNSNIYKFTVYYNIQKSHLIFLYSYIYIEHMFFTFASGSLSLIAYLFITISHLCHKHFSSGTIVQMIKSLLLQTNNDLFSVTPPIDFVYINRGDRLDQLRICVGQETCQGLAAAHLFMVGFHSCV